MIPVLGARLVTGSACLAALELQRRGRREGAGHVGGARDCLPLARAAAAVSLTSGVASKGLALRMACGCAIFSPQIAVDCAL